MKQTIMIILMALAIGIANGQQTITALHGNWKLISASGNLLKPLPETQVPVLRFDTGANTISGFAGCNQLSGQFTFDKEQLTIGPLILTKKACENIELEMILERFLTNVGYHTVERDSLYLYDKADKSRYLLFRRISETI